MFVQSYISPQMKFNLQKILKTFHITKTNNILDGNGIRNYRVSHSINQNGLITILLITKKLMRLFQKVKKNAISVNIQQISNKWFSTGQEIVNKEELKKFLLNKKQEKKKKIIMKHRIVFGHPLKIQLLYIIKEEPTYFLL